MRNWSRYKYPIKHHLRSSSSFNFRSVFPQPSLESQHNREKWGSCHFLEGSSLLLFSSSLLGKCNFFFLSLYIQICSLHFGVFTYFLGFFVCLFHFLFNKSMWVLIDLAYVHMYRVKYCLYMVRCYVGLKKKSVVWVHCLTQERVLVVYWSSRDNRFELCESCILVTSGMLGFDLTVFC